jgi:(1->4)-alpha-D-glucan 1-alpha-D-glucosylmutase
LRLARWPGTFSTTATHDTKRGEDARIRIDVLSELPDEWRTHLKRWAQGNAPKKIRVDDRLVPDRSEEYLLYQSLVAAWPFQGPSEQPEPVFVERIQNYLVKAAREAKLNTSWTDPDSTYVDALRNFVSRILAGQDAEPFLRDFLAFQRRVARIAVVHGLSQTLLKLTSPGVPDTYQGSELWDLSLVDPDNRRPVDYEARSTHLRSLQERLGAGTPRAQLARELYASPEDGAIKLYLIATVLTHRRENSSLYSEGSYTPLTFEGAHRLRVVAFARDQKGQAVLAVAPRLARALMGDAALTPPLGRTVWGDTRLLLPHCLLADRWRDLLTDNVVRTRTKGDVYFLELGEVFSSLPFALLVQHVNVPALSPT